MAPARNNSVARAQYVQVDSFRVARPDYLQHGSLRAARREQAGRHARSLAALTDENKRTFGIEIIETTFDLVHGNVDRAGNVSGGELGSGTDINQLGSAMRL